MKRTEIEIENVCLYCEHGCPVPGKDETELVLCNKKGLVPAGAVCRRFRYDLLKRDPRRPLPVAEYETVSID